MRRYVNELKTFLTQEFGLSERLAERIARELVTAVREKGARLDIEVLERLEAKLVDRLGAELQQMGLGTLPRDRIEEVMDELDHIAEEVAREYRGDILAAEPEVAMKQAEVERGSIEEEVRLNYAPNPEEAAERVLRGELETPVKLENEYVRACIYSQAHPSPEITETLEKVGQHALRKLIERKLRELGIGS